MTKSLLIILLGLTVLGIPLGVAAGYRLGRLRGFEAGRENAWKVWPVDMGTIGRCVCVEKNQ